MKNKGQFIVELGMNISVQRNKLILVNDKVSEELKLHTELILVANFLPILSENYRGLGGSCNCIEKAAQSHKILSTSRI